MRARDLLLFLLSAALMLALVFLPFSWAGWAPEACRLRNCYCEPFQSGLFVLQPFTALSNLGYVLAGTLVLAMWRRDSSGTANQARNPMRADPRYAVWLGVALTFTGWFSFFSHASLTRAGEWFDLMGVYQLVGMLLIYNLKRLLDPTGCCLVLLFAVLMAVLGIQMILAPQWQQVCIALLLVPTGLVEVAVRLRRHPRGPNAFFLAALACFAVGAGIWAANGRAPICPPGSFPWHIAWHILSAAAIFLLFRYNWAESIH